VTTIICGVDISKARLDAHVEAGDGSRGGAAGFANTAEGIALLVAWCRERKVELVAMEASGGFERLPYLLLAEAGIGCALVDARAVRRFAQSMGVPEKTDRIDARLIARFAAVKGLVPVPPPDNAQRTLTGSARRLSQLVGDLSICKQRIAGCHDEETRASMARHIAFLRQEIAHFEKQLGALIAADPLWKALAETFGAIKGVAGRTIIRLLADLPEIGLLPNKAVAKIAGLAPMANDSGRRQGKRSIRGGRASVRSILFLVADIARKYDPSLQNFVLRLHNAGKPKMVIRIALAHKLLVRLNAKARDVRKNATALA
jgi:transposase